LDRSGQRDRFCGAQGRSSPAAALRTAIHAVSIGVEQERRGV